MIWGKPKSLFAEKHLYSVESADGSRSAAFEKELSKLEGQTNAILKKIVLAVRHGATPGLSADEKTVLDRFFYIQWKRVPDMHSKVPALRNADANIEEVIAVLLIKYPDRAAELEALRAPEEKARLAKSAKVKAIGMDVGQVTAVLDQRGLAIQRAAPRVGSFAIGSSPIVRKRGDLRAADGDHGCRSLLTLRSDRERSREKSFSSILARKRFGASTSCPRDKARLSPLLRASWSRIL